MHAGALLKSSFWVRPLTDKQHRSEEGFWSRVRLRFVVVFRAAFLLERSRESPPSPCQDLAEAEVLPAMKPGFSCQRAEWSGALQKVAAPGACDNGLLLRFCWILVAEMIPVVNSKRWCGQNEWVSAEGQVGALAQAAQGGCGVSFSGEDLSGQGPVQPALGDPAWAGGWTR